MTAKSVRTLLLLLAAGAAGAACRKPPASEAETAAEAAKAAPEAPASHEALPQSVRLTPAAISEAGITTWKVQPVDLEHMLVLTGSVDYDENRLLQLAANVKGRAAAIRVDLGARVRKGDPILEIESVELGRAREELLRELVEPARLGARLRAREDAGRGEGHQRGRVPGAGGGLPREEGGGGGGRAGAAPLRRRRRGDRRAAGLGRVGRGRSLPGTTRPGSSCAPRSTAG